MFGFNLNNSHKSGNENLIGKRISRGDEFWEWVYFPDKQLFQSDMSFSAEISMQKRARIATTTTIKHTIHNDLNVSAKRAKPTPIEPHINDPFMYDVFGYIINEFIPLKSIIDVVLVCKHWRRLVLKYLRFNDEFIISSFDEEMIEENPSFVKFLMGLDTVRHSIRKSLKLNCYTNNDYIDHVLKYEEMIVKNVYRVDQSKKILALVDGGLFDGKCCDKFCWLEHLFACNPANGINIIYDKGFQVKPPLQMFVDYVKRNIQHPDSYIRCTAYYLFLRPPTSKRWELLMDGSTVKELYVLFHGACRFGISDLAQKIIDTRRVSDLKKYDYLGTACQSGALRSVEVLLNNGFRPIKSYMNCLAIYRGGKDPTSLIQTFKKCIPDKHEFSTMFNNAFPLPLRNPASTINLWKSPWGDRDTIMFVHMMNCINDHTKVSTYLLFFARFNIWGQTIPNGVIQNQSIWNCKTLAFDNTGMHILLDIVTNPIHDAKKIYSLMLHGHNCHKCMKIDNSITMQFLRVASGKDEWAEKLGVLLDFYKSEDESSFVFGRDLVSSSIWLNKRSLNRDKIIKLLHVILRDTRFHSKDLLSTLSNALKRRGKTSIAALRKVAKVYIKNGSILNSLE
jgi:hypothetical protein